MNYRPTQSELEILEILWEAGSATVREVNERLEKKGKNVGYTTTLKMMQLMADKGARMFTPLLLEPPIPAMQ
jgi:predicted transcriptional regulator